MLRRDIPFPVPEQHEQREAMARVGSLIIHVAHQVRNPLCGMSATLDALEALFGDQGEYREYFSILRREVNNLKALMQELLEYGRPPIQELSLEIIEEVIARAIHLCEPLAAQSGVKIADHIQKGMAPVLIDRQRLTQAFVNVFENAIQHSPAGETVIVEAGEIHKEEQCWVECIIRDNGPGFPPDDLCQVFEPFFTRRREGVGLGLPIAQRIVQEHGGEIQAVNESGCGAMIKVYLKSARID